MAAVKKARLDELLVAKGLADTRSQAKALILAGKVKIGTHRLDKPGQSLNADSEVTVESPPRFVSRGGEKLEGFLDHFEITMEGTHVLDVGASTGGFTDCSLQRGAINATCVDVGRAQMHNKLIQNDRVTNIENQCPPLEARRPTLRRLPPNRNGLILYFANQSITSRLAIPRAQRLFNCTCQTSV